MQTFLPVSCFYKSAEFLDYKRLGKQRVETSQIINIIEGTPTKDGSLRKGWLNHPVVVLWKDYLPSLKQYANIFLQEWINRGYNNTMSFYETGIVRTPPWLGKEEFHASHRSNLLRKDFNYYSKNNWKEQPTQEYVWIDLEGKWYSQYRGSKKRNYLSLL